MTDNGRKIEHHYTHPQNAKYIPPDLRWYVNTGGFLKLYSDIVYEDDDVPIEQSRLGSGYAERAMYPPQELGFAICLIRDNSLVDVKEVFL